jgi:hypothetical protein
MQINKDRLYVIPPTSKYFDEVRVDSFMENDFTLQLRCKINYNQLEKEQEASIFSRNGKHAGVSVYKNNEGLLFVHFTYWFWKDGVEPIMKCERYILPERFIDLYNTYTMICDHNNQTIKCYVNNEQTGLIDYEGLDKYVYTDAYCWFGCSNMVGQTKENANIGDFDLNFGFLSKSKFTIEEVDDITLNYKTKYTNDYVNELKTLSNNLPAKDSFGFFCDFNISCEYKVWNMVNNGIFPIIYMADNTHY